MPLPEGVTVFHNSENDGKLTSANYVSVHMQGDPTGKVGKVQIAKPKYCGHINRICVDCAPDWKDYEFYWDRTIGGRKLKAELDARRPD